MVCICKLCTKTVTLCATVSLCAVTVQCCGVSVRLWSWSLSQGSDGKNAKADLPGYSEVPKHAGEARDRKETAG